MTPILGVIDSAKTGRLSNPSYNFIATYTLGSDQRTVTFSSIPQTYKHLEFRIFAKSDFAGGAGGGTFAYATYGGTDQTYGLNQFATAVSTSTTNAGTDYNAYVGAPWERLSNGSDSADIFGAVQAIIPNYTNTNMVHTTKSMGGFNRVSGTPLGAVYINSTGYWGNTNAVTAVSMVPGDGGSGSKFKAGSVFSLYGIG